MSAPLAEHSNEIARLREVLLESERRLELAQSYGNLGLWSWNALTDELTAQPELEELYGVSRASFTRLADLATFTDPIEYAACAQARDAALASHSAFSTDYRIAPPDSEERWFRCKGHGEYNETGELVRVCGVNIDITERRRAEDQLRRNHDTFYRLIQNNPFGVYVIDSDFRLRQVSLGSQKVFSTVHPLLGRDFAEILRLIWVEPFASQAIDIFKHTLETGEPFVSPSTVERRADIKEIESYDWRLERIILPDGRFGVVCYFYDLSDRQRWERALLKSEEQLRFVTDHLPVLIVQCDAQARYLFVNAPYAERFGLNREQVIGKSVAEILGQRVYVTIRRYIDQVLRGERVEFEIQIPYEHAEPKWMHCVYVPEIEARTVKGFIGLIQDVTPRKEAAEALKDAQAKLREQNETLEQAVKERTAKLQETIGELEAFSYSIAHDMRAPLRALHGLSDVLIADYGPELDATAQGYLQRMAGAAHRMDRLITDVLSYSKIVRADFPLKPIGVWKLLHEIIQSYPALSPAHADIVLDGESVVVMGNEAMLTQCFSNLLGNAVKFVAPDVRPRIVISAETDGEWAKIRVADNGIGISDLEQTKIFKIFHRADDQYEGTGIGLSIVKKAAERMGGSVSVTSKLGGGSIFTVQLRLPPAA